MHTAGTVKIIPQDGTAKPPPLAAGALYHHCQAYREPAQGKLHAIALDKA